MKIKLDENLGRSVLEFLLDAGHEVTTLPQQGLRGAEDDAVYEHCRREGRCLVTLDLDFANVLRFPPERTEGLAVLRPHGRPTLIVLRALADQLVRAFEGESIAGHLWIVEPARVRIHEARED